MILPGRKNAKEHDESYLPDENFTPGKENPTYLLYNRSNELTGVISLMMDKGRFRILHSTEAKYDNYKCLLDKILPYTDALKNIYLFIPEGKITVRDILKRLDFYEQRYSWYLEIDNIQLNKVEFHDIFNLKSVQENKEENIWCDIINNNFKDHQGFSQLQSNDIKEMKGQNTEMLILWRGRIPIGTIQIDIEVEDNIKVGFISWLSINKQYRGMGLGRNLLRSAINLSYNNMAKKVGLVVHSTNENAIQLYQSEGFKKVEAFICYNKKI